jgi:CRP/FNR family transcriptional regulator, cyclic AMP receptor protein
MSRPPSNVCYVLREDPELAEGIDPSVRPQALDTVITREIQLAAGPWPDRKLMLGSGLGLLLLDGVLLHRIGINSRFGAELLGEGDVLRSPYNEGESTLSLTNDWLVLEPSRLALLDERFVLQLAHFPEVAGRLFSRAIARSRQLAVNMAIVHQARVDTRLHLLFWHLADRWGKVRPDGVVVPLRLTHAVLSDLVAARRPTVTSALSELGRRGLLRPVDEGWLLSGDPPTPVQADVVANGHGPARRS